MARIVVGIDGSDHAGDALRVAVDEARLRAADLTVVHAVPEPPLLADPVLMPPPPAAQRRATGEALLQRALDGVDVSGIDVERVVAIGNPTRILCDAAQGATLLVVASRGFGGFRGLLVGSVTQQVVAHAPCPILVIVPEER